MARSKFHKNRLGVIAFIGTCRTCGMRFQDNDNARARAHAYRRKHRVEGEQTVYFDYDYTIDDNEVMKDEQSN